MLLGILVAMVVRVDEYTNRAHRPREAPAAELLIPFRQPSDSTACDRTERRRLHDRSVDIPTGKD